jgi:hypothetical protein
VIDPQDCVSEVQDSQPVEANYSQQPDTLEVGDLKMLNFKDVLNTYINQDPFCWNL